MWGTSISKCSLGPSERAYFFFFGRKILVKITCSDILFLRTLREIQNFLLVNGLILVLRAAREMLDSSLRHVIPTKLQDQPQE